MAHSIFGWSYPPGCSGPPDDDEAPCQVCGNAVDNCICPECPQCGGQGDPMCYQQHGLVRTQEQIDSQKLMDDALEAEARVEAEFWEKNKNEN